MADRRQAGRRTPSEPPERAGDGTGASGRSDGQLRLSSDVQLIEIGPARPPCSVAEREIAESVLRRMRRAGWKPAAERVRAPTSPTWAPLVRALFRVWAAAFLAAGWPIATIALGAGAILGGIPPVAGLLRFIPLLGSPSRNVVGVKRGTDRDARPLVVVAHLDTHPTAGAPLNKVHVFLAAGSGWLALIAGIAARPGIAGWRTAAALIAAESVLTLAWLTRFELKTPREVPDDNTSGLLALARVAELIDGSQLRDTWLVATTAGTAGGYGLIGFFKMHPALKKAWVVEIDALGSGEVVASPFSARFPHPGTPSALTKALVGAAREAGDPLAVRRTQMRHSDARVALRRRVGAISLTAGLVQPAGVVPEGPDPANAERAARVVAGLANG